VRLIRKMHEFKTDRQRQYRPEVQRACLLARDVRALALASHTWARSGTLLLSITRTLTAS